MKTMQSLQAIQRASIALEDLRVILNLSTFAQENGALDHVSPEQHYGNGVNFSAHQIFLLVRVAWGWGFWGGDGKGGVGGL